MIAVAVSVGRVPVEVPSDVAVENNVLQVDPGLAQLSRILASVLIPLCGTMPFPAGVLARAIPVERVARLVAFRKALAIPICASGLPELDTWIASVAKPEKA